MATTRRPAPKRPLSSTLRSPLTRLVTKTPAVTRAPSAERGGAERKSQAEGESKQEEMDGISSLINDFLAATSKGSDSKTLEAKLGELRKAVLLQGPPDELKTRKGDGFTVRGRLWKVLLGIDRVDASEYMRLVEKKKSEQYGLIRNDTFRTFQKDMDFVTFVHEQELVRCLNAFVHKYHPYMSYCQGMNTICAPFLYTMPEVDAFFAFSKMITRKFPLYWVNNHIGAHAGCQLVAECLRVVDPELADHLFSSSLANPDVYFFHCVSSLCASIPPFSELLKLWDFLIAFGTHHVIILIVAQVVAIRQRLLVSSSPYDILNYREWPRLRARYIIAVAMSLLPKIPPDLAHRILYHAVDPAVCEKMLVNTNLPVKEVTWKGLPPHLT